MPLGFFIHSIELIQEKNESGDNNTTEKKPMVLKKYLKDQQ